jgi:hypothetical protein
MNFAAKMSRTSQAIRISVHAAGCSCLNMHGKKAPTWALEAVTVEAALEEVRNSEDAEARGIKVKAADCTKA